MEITEIEILQPDDWHVHFRDGEMLRTVAPYTAQQFGRAIAMPNLAKPIVRSSEAALYRERILKAIPPDSSFRPLMTCYLLDENDDDDLKRGFEEGIFAAAKLYPMGATTNAHHGVRELGHISRTLSLMEALGMPLLIHGEVVEDGVDIFDREKVFVDRHLIPLLERHPALKVVLEHVTTAYASDFIASFPGNRLAGTITAHHLTMNRNAMFHGGFRPHAYCLPLAKREEDRIALRARATSGSSKFFLGTDSAPHLRSAKESGCGCAGIFSAPVALSTYAEVFEQENALDKLEQFASLNGPAFYGLPANSRKTKLYRKKMPIPKEISFGTDSIECFRAGESTTWQIQP